MADAARGAGHLVIIGGHEDRRHGMAILDRFVALAGGPQAKIVVISAASTVGDKLWDMYRAAFASLGVTRLEHLDIDSRHCADGDAAEAMLADADGIFLTGGDQKRLLALIGGTRVDRALHVAYKMRHACIGGTSAGASAMSGHMLARGEAVLQPEKGAVNMAAGLGLVQHVLVDQHFSERQRLGRLLTAVAQNPWLQGVGIDEDTALVVARGEGIEVLGEGAVTIVDGRGMRSNLARIADGETPELLDVRLHLLPAGSRHTLDDGDGTLPESLRDFVRNASKAHLLD